jgi:hypothetical protein
VKLFPADHPVVAGFSAEDRFRAGLMIFGLADELMASGLVELGLLDEATLRRLPFRDSEQQATALHHLLGERIADAEAGRSDG